MDADAAGPFMALERRMVLHGAPFMAGEEKPTFTPPKEWARIDCSCRKADGCGKHGEKLLEGLTLYVRSHLPDDVTSTLSIRLGRRARQSIEADLDISRGTVVAEGAVLLATQQLLVMFLSLGLKIRHCDEWRMYYLVYDSTDSSLCMTPFISDDFVYSYTEKPVPRFTGAGRDHELVLLARKLFLTSLARGRLVCVCSAATRATAASNVFESNNTGVWQVKQRRFPELPCAFSADEVFSFQGKAFWADLAQGLVYCDLERTSDKAVVEFDFISLPSDYIVRGLKDSLRKTRTIGCIGGSIHFVCIDDEHCHSSCHPGNEKMVKVWTLDMDRHLWKEDHKGFPCAWKEIWMQVYSMYDANNVGSRDVRPQYPVLMPGGALCLLLSNSHWKKRVPEYICSFNMHSKMLMWSGCVRDYCTSNPAAILPCNFFVKNNYPPPSKRALPTHRTLEERAANTQEEGAKKCKPRHHQSRFSNLSGCMQIHGSATAARTDLS